MPEAFDPYYRWLGIPPEARPADHYRLLGIKRFEENADVIETAADRQTVHLRTFQIGPYSDLSQKLLSEVATARHCLLDRKKKASYDARLREEEGSEAADGPSRVAGGFDISSLLDEVDTKEAGPRTLVPLRRRRGASRRWLIGGVVAVVFVAVAAGLVGAVAWGVGRITQWASHATGEPSPTPPILPPIVAPVELPPQPVASSKLAGSSEESSEPPLLRTLTGHARPICAVAFSPDGSLVATGSKDGTVGLWETATGRMSWAGRVHAAEVNGVAFAPDGKTLVSAGDDRTIRVWDVESGGIRRVLAGHEAGIRAVGFDRDGRLASAGHDRTVRVWDIGSGETVQRWDAPGESIMTLEFSPDGRLLATGGLDRSVRLWDAETGRLVRTLDGHEQAVRAVAFNRDGDRIVSGGEDGRWIIWDAATGEMKRSKQGHDDRVLAVAFHPDGKLLATAGRAAAEGIRLWDAASGERRGVLAGHARETGSLAFSPDGSILASGGYDRVARLWLVE